MLAAKAHLCRKILEKMAEIADFDDKPGKGIAIMINVEDAVGVAHQVESIMENMEESLLLEVNQQGEKKS
jgi:hypothetical protein